MKRVYKILFIVIVISGSELFGQWPKYIIDNALSTPEVVAIGDLNGDTKLDVVVNDLNKNKVIWYENNVDNPFSPWIKHVIDSYLAGAYVTDIGDLDGDGDLDIAASGYRGGNIVWYENNHPDWNRHTIAENLKVSGAVSIADIDGDDTLDIVSSGYRQGGDLVWYENNHPTWPKHTIRSNYATEWSWVGDIDGDGAIDVAVARWYENEVNWFRNENAGLTWTEFIIDDSLEQASHLYFGDIDGDNDMDITAAGASDDYIVWYENNQPEWNRHTIDNNLKRAWCVVVVDIDGDEKPDVAATSRDADKVVWYKNNHPEWEKHIIDEDLDGALLLVSADIDNDNASDIIVPGVNEGNLVWYKNPHTSVAFGESIEVYPKYFSHTDDTLKITAEISNPENHEVSVYVFANGNQSVYQDSIELFDDGLHGDGAPSDNICANNILLPSLEEDIFEMKLVTADIKETRTTYSAVKAYFTTAGPVNWVDYDIQQLNDSLYSMKVTLQNNGSSFTVSNISARLSTNDSNIPDILSSSILQSYPDIEPGQFVQNSGFWNYRFYTKNSSQNVEFQLDIYSNNQLYWTDTLMVDLPPTTDMEDELLNLPKEFTLEQNYPNPFNPSTTIKYSIPTGTHPLIPSREGKERSERGVLVTLRVYDILGREVATLVNQKQKPGHYEVEFDGSELTSGIYFYQLQAGKYLVIKKMLMIK